MDDMSLKILEWQIGIVLRIIPVDEAPIGYYRATVKYEGKLLEDLVRCQK